MKHLTDQELVWLLYRESDGQKNAGHRDHLLNCAICTKRFDELERVTVCLDSHSVPDRAVEIDAPRIEMHGSRRRNARGVELPSLGHQKGNWAGKAQAASVLFAVGAISFVFGIVYQERSRSHADSKIERSSVEIEQSLRQQIDQLKHAIAKLPMQPTALEAESLSNVELLLARLANEQENLRRDLQTLAVNAESEIRHVKQQFVRRNEIAGLSY